MRLTHLKGHVIALLLTTLISLSSCQRAFMDRPGATQTPRPTKTATPLVTLSPTPTRYPTQTPTPEPLGSNSNPLVMGVISADQNEINNTAASELAIVLRAQTSLTFNVVIFDSYASLAEGIRNYQVHLAWLMPLEYLLANQDYLFDAELVSSHLGVKSYGIQILANSEAAFQGYYDAENDKPTADVFTALAQFSGTRPCFSKTDILAGYLVPSGLLKQASILINDPVITFSTAADIRAVYSKGICDFTATYATFADPRTAAELLADYPDLLEKVEIIWRSDPIIPNLSLSYSPKMNLAMRTAINEALISFAATSAGQSTLTRLNDYQIEGLGTIKNASYDYLRYLLEIQGVEVETLVETGQTP